MPRFEITSPDGKKFEINAPEGATQDQALQYAQKQFTQPKGDTLELAKEPSALDNGIAGFKKAFTDLGQGLGQVAGTVSREDVAKTRAQDQELMDTTSGKVGNVVGNIAATLPAAFIPGVNTVVGGGLIMGGIGAIQPSTSTRETIGNTLGSGIGGVIGAKLSQFLAGRAARRAARSQAVAPTLNAKNAANAGYQADGYVIPPQDVQAGPVSQALNAWAGKQKTQEASSVHNQSITNVKAARSIGLPENEPITVDAIDGVRKQAGKAYEAVRSVGVIKADGKYQQDLADIVKQHQSANKSFPGLIKDDAMSTVKKVSQKQFDADSAVDAIKLLRDKGSVAYRAGDKSLGGSYKKAADAIESMIERHLQTSGAPKELLTDFQNSRALYAKTFSVEKALNKGSGNVRAGKLATDLNNGKLLTDDLKDIGSFAATFPKSAQELQGANPSSVLDIAAAASAGKMGKAMLGYAAGRPFVRSLILNPTYQKMFVKGSLPSENVTSLMRLGSKVATPITALSGIGLSKEDKN